MSKLIVIKEPEGDRFPFLRGILTQSLVNIGLPFVDAYDLARIVRHEFQKRHEITSNELKAKVADLLEKKHDSEMRRLYEIKPQGRSGIIVHTPTCSEPFSVGILARSLESSAIPKKAATQGARMVLATLKKTGHLEVDHKALRRITYKCLNERCSQHVADRYLSWRRFKNSGIPLIILIGGATGTGKSAVSSELTYRLDLLRHQSSGMMREIIRPYLSPKMVPTLKYSSFEAWRGLPDFDDVFGLTNKNQVVTGFLSQLSAMKLALKATIDRAIEDRQHLVLEGIHVVPTELNLEVEHRDAIVVPIMLAIREKKSLSKRFKRSAQDEDKHHSTRNLEYLDEIWELQSWLLDEADKAGVHIIENWYIEDTVRAVMDLVIDVIIKHFPPRLDDEMWND